MNTRVRLGVLITAAAVLFALPATAGTISLAWDAVTDPNLAGYRVYYGTSAANYSQSLDVGNVTTATIPSLTDCTTWYLAVKAYNTSGVESTAYSNEVSGWPRPILTSVVPSSA